jgi:FKBP-type peptidyl-prolyl cis-trans isomerase 2
MDVKLNDFIEINYIGRFKDNNQIFDLTDAKVAKANHFNPKLSFKPVIVCVGNGDVVKGLDNALVGKEVGKMYTIEVLMDMGFGKKNPKLMRLVPTTVFIKQKINPVPGLQVTINDSMGIIRSVSGGRTLVDFNHPYAGHDLVYEVEILRKLEDDAEKLKSFFELHFNIKDIDIKMEEGIAKIPIDVPEVISKPLFEHLKKILPNVKSFEFKKPEPKKQESKKDEAEKSDKKPKKQPSEPAKQ